MSSATFDLCEEFARNGHCQRVLAHNGDVLLSKMKPSLDKKRTRAKRINLDSMNSFVGALQTLVSKTMEDTSITLKAYEKSR